MEREVGFKTRFHSTGDVIYEIKEVIDFPNFNMTWTWGTGICPHCKNSLDRVITHEFYKIEILAPENIKLEDIKQNDLVIAGFTVDKRYMVIPKQYYTTILSKTTKFKTIGGI